jgi:sugar phosphate isomerase/epimerase
MNEWGFDTWIYEMLPVERALERLQAFGIRYGEYAMEHFEKIVDRDQLDEKIRTLSDFVKSLSIRMIQMHAPYGELDRQLGSVREDERRRGIEWARRWLGYASQLGVGVLVVHSALGERGAQPDSIAAIRADAESNIRAFGELSRYARDLGVKIAIENRLEGIFGSRIGDLLAVVGADPDALGICLDTGHAMVNGVSPDVAAKQAGDRLIATHIHDNDGHHDQHLPPLMGSIDWASFAESIDSIRYPKPLIVEILGSTSNLRVCDNRLLLTKGAIDCGIIGRVMK